MRSAWFWNRIDRAVSALAGVPRAGIFSERDKLWAAALSIGAKLLGGSGRSVSLKFVFSRIIWIVLDSVGVGEMPDAAAYGDAGSDTLGNIVRQRGLRVPNLCAMGLRESNRWTGCPRIATYRVHSDSCTLASPGKRHDDRAIGGMVGIHLDRPFPWFPKGFPR